MTDSIEIDHSSLESKNNEVDAVEKMRISWMIDAAVKAMNWEDTCIAFQMKLSRSE